MLLTIQQLEACVGAVAASEDAPDSLHQFADLLGVLGSREDLRESFLRGTGSDAVHDYPGVHAAFQRLLGKDARWSREAGEKLRALVACSVFPQPAQQALAADQADEGEPADPSKLAQGEPADPSAEAGGGHAEEAAKNHGEDRSTCASRGAEDCPLLGLGGGSPAWVPAMLAALLPLLADALPRDHNGVCIIPHHHEMVEKEAQEHMPNLTGAGRPIYRTNKICDNCGSRITDSVFYHCGEECDIDFCQECHKKSHELLCDFMTGARYEDRDAMNRCLFWVIDTTERIGYHVLRLSVADRRLIAHELAFEWPTWMFKQLVQAAIDVVNAKVVHVQDVKDIRSDERFWYAVGWLQFLYSTNSLPCNTTRLDEQSSRGPKVAYDQFILEGLNKCEPFSEFKRWRQHPHYKLPDVLAVETFTLTADFCSFLTHSNLVPYFFRRVCLLCDVWEQIQALQTGRIQPLLIEVPREPHALLEEVLTRFAGLSDSQLRRPLRVSFVGEEAVGPGVTKEFFQVALRSFLDGGARKLFQCNGHQRTYWFDGDADSEDAYRACGIILGQAVLNNVLVPNIFPKVLYQLLLHDLDSQCVRPLCLQDLATVCEDTANSLQQVLQHAGDDIGAVFGDLDWKRGGRLPADAQLSQGNKADFVQGYVDWFFNERFVAQYTPLSTGFRSILGDSSLLRSMVDAVQLEQIVCGGAVPVDVAAIRRGAQQEGWTPREHTEYLPFFWEVLEGFDEGEKMQFIIFVTASGRVPLRGWQDLNLIVHKSGVGDDRLPAAYTCFNQLLLPKYSSKEHLKHCLLAAIKNSEGFGLK